MVVSGSASIEPTAAGGGFVDQAEEVGMVVREWVAVAKFAWSYSVVCELCLLACGSYFVFFDLYSVVFEF